MELRREHLIEGRDRENCPDMARWEIGLPRTSAQPLTPHSTEAASRPLGLELLRTGSSA